MKLYEIGPKIKELRLENKLSQDVLAKKSGISRVTLGKLERGEIASISLKTLDLILSSVNYEISFEQKKNFGLPTLDELIK